jgi:iron complex outermembrane receptor protein
MNDISLNKIFLYICLLLFGVTSFSQDNVIEEVFVTAEKRSESLQDISQAVTAISDQDIDSKNIESIVDLKCNCSGGNCC